jgi:murein tripeptide amidase MpaA
MSLVLAVSLIVALHTPSSSTGCASDADSVVRVDLKSIRDVRLMESLSNDMWSHGIYGGKAEYLVTPQQRQALARTNLTWCTVIEDVGALVRAEAARLAAPPTQGGVADESWFADFKSLDAINARLDALASLRPDIASVITIGQSLEGRPIRGLRISSLASGTLAPAIVFDGTQHAREWGATMTTMYVADRLVETASTDPQVASLLGRAEFFVIPVVNVDGYFFTWANSANRLWRKNRRDNGNGTFGVDTNRNWGYQWGGAGASTDPGSDTYRGPSPFSEPETIAMRNFFVAHPTIVATIDFHAYSQLVLSPWAYTVAPTNDNALYAAIGQSMAASIASTSGLQYTVGPVGSTLYLASGGSVDWTYGDRGALSWTIEVRDTGAYGFIMPPAEILPCARECFAAAMAMAEATAQSAIVSLPNSAPTQLVPGSTTPFSVKIREAFPGAVTARSIVWRVNGGSWQSASLAHASGDLYTATLPAVACASQVDFYVDTTTASGGHVRFPDGGSTAPLSATAVTEVLLASCDFESATPAWSYGIPGDSATAGQWVRGDPVGTAAQPENDHTEGAATQCAFTGQGVVGGALGAADVDGGVTTLQSPVLCTMETGARLRAYVWYSNNAGSNPNQDSMPVQVSGDGVAWTTLATISQSAAAWTLIDLPLDSAIPLGAGVRVRFVAQDLGGGSIVEAAIDDVTVTRLGCGSVPGDLNGDGAVDGLDLGILLSQWGGAGSADSDGNGVVDAVDLGALLAHWG